MPGLDGIRAVAVLAVLLFHFGVDGFAGGMLGVDMFFALSGYLITTILVSEHQRSGGIRLGKFYERRARRLLPALFVTLLIVAAYAAWFAESDTLAAIRADALSTLGYVANWWYVVAHQSYFVQNGPPSPLLHTWSLAVEEQFYLIWPLVSLLVLRKWGTRALAALAGLGAVGSVFLTVALQAAGLSTDRLYYGTDTRAQAILVGAFLAAIGPGGSRVRSRAGGVRMGSVTGNGHVGRSTLGVPRWCIAGAGFLGLAWCAWSIHEMSQSNALLYRGGFFLMAVATSFLIVVAVIVPRSIIGNALSWAPLRYIGRISYGLYLYHWPLSLMIDEGHTGLGGWELLLARLSATLALSVVSYHLLEKPVRERRLFQAWRGWVGVALGASGAAAAVVTATVLAVPGAIALPASAKASMAVPPGSFTTHLLRTSGMAPGQTVRALVLGDSLGLTLGMGLSVHSGAWGVTILDQAVLGCDLDPGSTVNMQQGPVSAAQGCAHWQSTWAKEVATIDPDVVAIELGRWEVSDRLVDGKWTRIGEPLWDDLYSRLLDQAINIVSRHGAKVVLFNLPYIKQTTEAPNGQPWEINQPVRTNQYNALLHEIAARHQGLVTLVDLNKLLDPEGHYTSYVDGVDARNSDEEHPSIAGGELLRPEILPVLFSAGLAHEHQRVAAPQRLSSAQGG